jgi:protease-4
MLALPALVIPAVLPVASRQAAAQVRAEEPTGGLNLPAVGLAGEPDALSVVSNPAGMQFLRGGHFMLGFDFTDRQAETGGSPGFGVYNALAVGGGLLPRLGIGLGLEFLRPERAAFLPDPGSPTRLTLALSAGLGEQLAVGASFHHFYDDAALPLSGLDSWDLGLSARLGSRFALGFVLRDLFEPTVAGGPVQRRHELELLFRPLATDRLELAVGGRVGEIRGDLDGWLRWSTQLVRGVYLRGAVELRSQHLIAGAAVGRPADDELELRASAGLELSFGAIGLIGHGTLTRSDAAGTGLRGGSVFLRVSGEQLPSILPAPQRIERIELSGSLEERALLALVVHLRSLARDPQVAGVLVQLGGAAQSSGVRAGWAMLQDIRSELSALRRAGKRVIAFIVAGSTQDYFLASVADRIYVDPAGGLWLDGFAATSVYFKALFDQLGVQAQFERIAEYKSAPETYTATGPSEPALRMRNALYDSLYADLVATIASARKLAPDKVRALIAGGPYTAGDLGRLGALVDGVVRPDELPARLAKDLGAIYPIGSAAPLRPERWQWPGLAVIYIDGDIVDGKSRSLPLLGRSVAGGETIARALAAAREDPGIAAVVLRINSPGGSALASEIIAREVFKTRGVKPILCSLGDVAASGGYFAAAGCDLILAQPMTVTGSIGIFNGKFDVSQLAARLGLSWHTFKRGERADMSSYFRPWTPEERTLVLEKLRYYYDRFLQTVADGRRMSTRQVDGLGRGRVWSGRQARGVKLVDRLGGIGDTIALAKARIGLGETDRVRLVLLPEAPSSLVERLLGAFGLPTGDAGLDLSGLGGLAGLLRSLPASLLVQPDVPQARLPFDISWE